MLDNFRYVGIIGTSLIIIVFVLLAILVFEIWMIISAVCNSSISSSRKALWIIGMLLVHPFVAIAYYFTDYKKSK